MRPVLDTNVLIAAFYQPLRGPSFSKEVFDYLVDQGPVYLSPAILKEFREKCSTKLKMAGGRVNELVALLRSRAEVVFPAQSAFARVPVALRDPNDRHVLALALTVDADVILTWDKDLLVLEKMGKSRILTPRDFWEEQGRGP